ncbi:MAG TPA: HAMP domain-containing histidine kinase [Deltaproteobacteria bacterium]|nr:HAMP domain-containing histidine kinase [Deltaproteobacteria bacterium]
MTPDKAKQTVPSESFFREIQIEFLIHELKGPVSVIETALKTLLEKQEKFGPLSSKQERTLQRALKNAKKTREMINDLLEIGRSEAGCFLCCRFHLGKAIRDVLMEELETLTIGTISSEKSNGQIQDLETHGVFLIIEPQTARSEMLQDETKFRQIFGNLIKNALRHRKNRIDIRVFQENNQLVVDVSDDGPGVNPEDHELIFKRYVQANQGATLERNGHGLGLAGALIMARSLGGDIRLKSEAGKGATFRLILPMTMEQPKIPDECTIP